VSALFNASGAAVSGLLTDCRSSEEAGRDQLRRSGAIRQPDL